jgi:hypothetical protein
MIQPQKISKINVRPEAVHLAFTSWDLFVKANTRSTVAGVGVVNVSYAVLVTDFFDRLVRSGGTPDDVDWLVEHDVMADGERNVWPIAVARNASVPS